MELCNCQHIIQNIYKLKMTNKKMKGKKIEVNVSNKLFYTIIAILAVLIIATGVYAYHSGGPPSVIGHSMEELEPPQRCGDIGYNEGWLRYRNGVWICQDEPSGSGLSTPVTCTGTNKGLQWDGSSWKCVTFSSSGSGCVGTTSWEPGCLCQVSSSTTLCAGGGYPVTVKQTRCVSDVLQTRIVYGCPSSGGACYIPA